MMTKNSPTLRYLILAISWIRVATLGRATISWLSQQVTHIYFFHCFSGQFSLVAQWLNNPPGMRETSVQSLVWKDPLEKKMAIHPSILPWRISWREEPGTGSVHGVAKNQVYIQFSSVQSLSRFRLFATP